jgi:hypothetical protein
MNIIMGTIPANGDPEGEDIVPGKWKPLLGNAINHWNPPPMVVRRRTQCPREM